MERNEQGKKKWKITTKYEVDTLTKKIEQLKKHDNLFCVKYMTEKKKEVSLKERELH